MVLGLLAHRVLRSGSGALRPTGRKPANSHGTVLLPYPGSLPPDAPLPPRMRSRDALASGRDPETRASHAAAPALSGSSPWLVGTRRRTEERKSLRHSRTSG